MTIDTRIAGKELGVTAAGAADRHVPVLAARITELLTPALDQPGAVFLDGTLGMGGHSEAILAACPQVTVYGVDRDTQALTLAGERLAPYGDRFRPVHAVYDEAIDALAERGVTAIDGALFDLGVSSLQLDETDRGFAYSVDAPLDMRMDQSTGPTAADVLNGYAAADLERILRTYGEERFARRIAAAIVRERERQPFTDSARLVELLRQTIPAASQRTGGHPGKRTFQALRIEVNGELAAWEAALPAAVDALAVGGRIAVLSYHSLEDRITKRALAAGATSTAPPGLPVELPEHAPYLALLTRGAEQPSQEEISNNPRAASARLRAAERILPTNRGVQQSRSKGLRR
ncbi:16S rRNA (cytosine(1402)-N(4))-methyltransferase RsmH [Flexivirga oryzae]|uniref:Ribosomal RNA small subunit methyltransferase H n=1 Tax=Flexivirga oryzae TaxID=1794944 RepID=A0A839N3Q2_9MICO|nr:16S rRNA (cytosine(1402)-N(4))-methyltransferase RsmH [Flexivirga oryzae]MBB2890593.1 16S rRNA (cytosine1402-N4)-methyltransferase [Flexivirga oryzae]